MLRPIEVTDSGGLRYVVVYLREAPVGVRSHAEVVLDQRGCTYAPHVLSAAAGQTVVFRNSDMTLHSIHVRPTANPEFNIGQPRRSMETRRVFDNPEIGIPIRCDVHPWVTAFLSVFAHPYHTTTDAGGNFTIGQIPDGTYVIEARHEVLGTLTREVTIAGGRATADFGFGD
jgi:plastocyanin